MRAPIFNKSQPAQIDPKANLKNCNEEIIHYIFRIVDQDDSGGITFAEYKKSFLARRLSEKVAREIFVQMDVDGNNIIDYDEFSQYHTSSGTLDNQTMTMPVVDMKG
jgi:Ca2+-binding EF-hand superfamily protein